MESRTQKLPENKIESESNTLNTDTKTVEWQTIAPKKVNNENDSNKTIQENFELHSDRGIIVPKNSIHYVKHWVDIDKLRWAFDALEEEQRNDKIPRLENPEPLTTKETVINVTDKAHDLNPD